MKITAGTMAFKELNEKIQQSADAEIQIDECYGQRFIGSALDSKKIKINGTPGNGLGAYMDGAEIEVNGNAQDAVGDTMNDGKIIVHGNAGDALGYAMRGGAIFVKGNVGYRAGILMKEYRDKKPLIFIGGTAGSFLGEYLAGGLIIVLGIDADGEILGNFTGTGMHGGRIFVRSEDELPVLPRQVQAEIATGEEIAEITPHIKQYGEYFGIKIEKFLQDKFYVLKPNVKNQYTQLYVKH